MKLITVSNIQKVFLSNLNVKGEVQLFIKALDKNEIPYEIYNDGKIEVLLFDNPLISDFNKRIENVFKKHVWGFSKIVWKISPLNCGISNLKEIYIRDLENSLTIPVAQFKEKIEKSSLNVSYGSKTIGLRLKKPNFTYNSEKYTSDFENVLKYVKTIDRLNWQ
jgi:hypothetical protein